MSEERLLEDNPLVIVSSKKKRRKVGVVWILIGVLCFIIKKIIRFANFSLMMTYGIENGISASPLGFLCDTTLWSAVIALCFTIAFILIFFDINKLKERIRNIKKAEDSDSDNSVHY